MGDKSAVHYWNSNGLYRAELFTKQSKPTLPQVYRKHMSTVQIILPTEEKACNQGTQINSHTTGF